MTASKSIGLLLISCVLMHGTAEALPFPGRTPANKVTASDAEIDDAFGGSVAISGNLALIGASGEDGAGSSRGAAYLIDMETGTELFKLNASDTQNNDFFGSSVAISGNLGLVGARFEDGPGTNQGAAYAFNLDTRTEFFKLVASDAQNDDSFGISVSLSGNFALVGASGEDGDGGDRGAAYVFDLSTEDELFKLTANDGQDGDSLGNSVAVSGNLALVGASNEDGEGTDRGAAYLFDINTGGQLRKLTALDAQDNDHFGSTVSIFGSIAMVGAPSEDGNGDTRGAVYVFDLVTGAQLFKLTASDTEDGDRFGESVAISGNVGLVGATGEDGDGTDRGAIYAFDLNSGAQLEKLTASDPQNSQLFGGFVGLSGTLAIVGAPKDGAGLNRGAVYAFTVPVRRSDLISGSAPSSGVGRGILNASAAGQTTPFISRRLAKISGFFTLIGDGNTGDDCLLSATPGNSNFSLKYLQRGITGVETNATAALLAGNQIERNVSPDEAGRVYRVEITPSQRLRKRVGRRVSIRRNSINVRLTATSQSNALSKDTAAVSVQTR